MFVCGQTVYDDAHLGHAKTYINFDNVVRWLRYLDYKVKYVQNITDVDDKIIARARESNVDPAQLAHHFEQRFFEDMKALDVKQNVDMYPRSSEYMKTIEEQVQMLFDNGYAYYLDGDVYYDVSKFADYNKLSGMKITELEKHRIEPKEGKRHVYDFALWKAAKPGEPKWDIYLKMDGDKTKLSGRPGWHIEDTAMTYAIFGAQYDVHGGASELIFPHHTNEIAQAEAATGKRPFVKYWLHGGVLNIRGAKMSKSLKNFIKIREVLGHYDSEVLRLFFASTHYRKEINYTGELLAEAEKRLSYLYQSLGAFYNMGETVGEQKDETELAARLGGHKKHFEEAMNDDFNTPLALQNLVYMLNEVKNYAGAHERIRRKSKEEAMSGILKLAATMGLLEKKTYKEKVPKEVEELIKKREELRKKKMYKEADEIRSKLMEEHNVILEDTVYGVVWYKRL